MSVLSLERESVMNVRRLTLDREEARQVQAVLRELASRFSSSEEQGFLDEATVWAHELPRSVRRELNQFRLHEVEPAVVVSGYPLDDDRIGPTPAHWKDRHGVSRTLEEEMLLVLLASLLGDAIGWSTQQDGYVVHDVLPIRGHEKAQIGSGSEELITWHTEDAFHPFRGDYLGMMCLRNPDRVATTVTAAASLRLAPEHVRVLFEPRFPIRPDESHRVKSRPDPGSVDSDLGAAYDRIERMFDRPEKIAVLSGDPRAPYLRLDPYFMDRIDDDPEGQAAFDALTAEIDANLVDLVLEPGDCCFIDNYRAVHGRQPFKARYDGKDRWMKRINVARDLRKSRSARRSGAHRIIS